MLWGNIRAAGLTPVIGICTRDGWLPPGRTVSQYERYVFKVHKVEEGCFLARAD